MAEEDKEGEIPQLECTNINNAFVGNHVIIVARSPDGKLDLVASSSTQDIYQPSGVSIIEAQTQRLRYLQHPARVCSAEFSADSKFILTACFDNNARLWSVDDGTLFKQYPHDDSLISASFSPCGLYFVTHTRLYDLRVWSLEDDRCVLTIPHGAAVFRNFPRISRGGVRILATTTSGAVQVLDGRTGTQVHNLHVGDGTVTAAEFSPDESRILACGYTGEGDARRGFVALWESDTGVLIRMAPVAFPCAEVFFSPDGAHAVLRSMNMTRNEPTAVLDVERGEVVAEMRAEEGYIASVAFDPSGDTLVTASAGVLRTWNFLGLPPK